MDNVDEAKSIADQVKAQWVTITEVVVRETTETSEEFDWLKCLNALVAGTLTAAYGSTLHRQLRRLAGGWPSCACGQLCANLPRNPYDGSPRDPDLKALGYSFYHAVERADWPEALHYFKLVEERTAELLSW